MLGDGKYDPLLTDLLQKAGASQGLVIVVDGSHGPGASVKATLKTMQSLQSALMQLAVAMQKDIDEIDKKEQENANKKV